MSIDTENKTIKELQELLENAVFNMLSCEDRLALSKALLEKQQSN